MTIKKIGLPANSILVSQTYDYMDSYQGFIENPNKDISVVSIGKAFFLCAPKWVDKLFKIRNKIVSLFGLKTPGQIVDKQKLLDNFKCEKGEQLGLFKVIERTDQEVILGEDDKHLNFRVSLLIDNNQLNVGKKTISISTTVKFKNWFGRLYFFLVRPFHKLIVPIMLKEIMKQMAK